MAGPLDGLDLGAPTVPTTKPTAPSGGGVLSGIDLNAPDPNAKQPTYDDTTWSGLAGDTLYRAANTGTLGALDYATAGVHAAQGEGYGDALRKIHQQNAEWGANHPYLGLGADLAGYTLGAGKIGLGARIAGRVGEGIGARILGSAAENALASAVSEEASTAGQASTGDLLKHATIAGTVGAMTGAIPGQKGALANAPTKDLGAETAQAFQPLEQTHYHPNVIANDFDAVKTGLAAKQTASDSLDGQISKISQRIADKQKAGQSVTADDLTNFQIDINGASRGGRDIGIAKAYNDALDKTMATQKPLFSPLSGPAEISAQSDAARALSVRKNVSSDIGGWMTDAARKGPEATKADIIKATEANPNFYPGGVGPLLQQASQPMGLGGKIATKMANPIGDAAVTGVGDYLFGSHDPTTSFLMGLGGAAGGAVASHALAQSRTNNLVNQLAAARHLNATGQTMPAASFNRGISVLGPLGARARGAGVGVGVSNLFNQ